MKKVVLIPLDERPCNYNYPKMIKDDNISLIMPNIELLGSKKTPADIESLKSWIIDNTIDADYLVISLDMAIFGGIVPSRLHHNSLEYLLGISDTLKAVRENNKDIIIYAFELIMRCPSYNSGDEEPDYYEYDGLNINRYGYYSHKDSLGLLSKEEIEDFNNIKSNIIIDNLNDFVERRRINIEVLLHNLSLLKEGIIDYFVIPQDDSCEYGYTALDQIRVKKYLKDNGLENKCPIYPGADEVGIMLLSRVLNHINNKNLKIHPIYLNSESKYCIPLYEDRALYKTVEYQIMVSGSTLEEDINNSDLVLLFTNAKEMVEEYEDSTSLESYSNRDFKLIDSVLKKGKLVGIADNAYPNKGDYKILDYLIDNNKLFNISSYAGWNTSSNTMGTTIANMINYYYSRNDIIKNNNLVFRYIEDVLYMGYVRKEMREIYKNNPSLTPALLSKMIKEKLLGLLKDKFDIIYKEIEDLEIKLPWDRLFEIELKVKFRGIL